MTSDPEQALLFQIRALGLPEPQQEWRIVPTRRYRFDLAFVAARVAVEIDGATWQNGRHNRGTGIETDCEKGALALIAGWRVLRVTAGQVADGRAVAWLAAVLIAFGEGAA